jgi:hypothetical protein
MAAEPEVRFLKGEYKSDLLRCVSRPPKVENIWFLI